MKKSNISGWKDVFSFTLIQMLKNKAFIITFVVLVLFALASTPILNLITPSEPDDIDSPNPVQKIYVINETNLVGLDFTNLLNHKTMDHIVIEIMDESYETITNRIEENEQDSIILTLSETEEAYFLTLEKASTGPVKNSSMHLLSIEIREQFETLLMTQLGISREQRIIMTTPIETKVTMVDFNGTEMIYEDTSISFNEYWFIYGVLFLILMINIFASTQIATSIVTEKSTRVVEYLLISVKPLALMVGKIIAMLVAVLLQLISVFIVVTISNKVFAGNGQNPLTEYLPSDMFQNLNIINIVLCIIVIALGLIFYGALAGVAGATVSKLDEVNEGLTVFTLINLVGAYIGLGASGVLMGSGINTFVIFSFLFPLSAPFILPGSILVGRASLPLAAGAIGLQILFIILLFLFVARVYETLILHSGNKVKLKELIKLSKTVSKEDL